MVSPRFYLSFVLLSGMIFLSSPSSAVTLCLDGFESSRGATLSRDELRRIADLCREEKREVEALQLMEKIPVEERLPGDTLLLGALEIVSGEKSKDGIARLLVIDPGTLAASERVERWQVLLQGLKAQGETFNALAVIDQSLPLAMVEERRVLCREEDALLKSSSDEELSRFVSRIGLTPLRYDLQTERGRRAWQSEEVAAARKLLEEALSGTRPFCQHSEALQLRDKLEGRPWLRRAIGVILPLQDKFASFGEAVQRGINMAVKENRPGSTFPFILRDRNSDPEENRQAVEELVQDERVMAIIGPLTGGAALAAGEAAQKLQVPLLTLAQKDGVPELGDYVFRDAMTSRNQVETLVRYAMEVEGRKRFAVLAPENRLGQEFADLFAQAVLRHGGTLVVREGYSDSGSDFRTPIKRLKGEDPAIPDSNDREARKRGRMTPPPLPFDALFIPDIGERVALLSPYLAYYGVENVLLLGTSAWNTPELLERSSRYVEGAVFTDGFYPGSDLPTVRDFVARYLEIYGDEPTFLEAEGYDVASILIGLLENREVRTRSDLRSALAKVRNYPGVTGEISFGPFGDALKSPFLLRIYNGALISAR